MAHHLALAYQLMTARLFTNDAFYYVPPCQMTNVVTWFGIMSFPAFLCVITPPYIFASFFTFHIEYFMSTTEMVSSSFS